MFDVLATVSTFWNCDPRFLDRLLFVEGDRIAEAVSALVEKGEFEPSLPTYEIRDNIAVVGLKGPLLKSYGPFAAAVGATILKSVARWIGDAVNDPGVVGIVVAIVDCPGGEFHGAARVIDEIARAGRAGKPVACHIQGGCAGTAYLIASHCGTIVAESEARIGPIAPVTWAVHGLYSEDDDLPTPSAHDLRIAEHLQRSTLAMIHAARPQGDAETLARIADAGFVLAEVAEHFGLIDGILPRDAVVDRLARGDVLSEAKL